MCGRDWSSDVCSSDLRFLHSGEDKHAVLLTGIPANVEDRILNVHMRIEKRSGGDTSAKVKSMSQSPDIRLVEYSTAQGM